MFQNDRVRILDVMKAECIRLGLKWRRPTELCENWSVVKPTVFWHVTPSGVGYCIGTNNSVEHTAFVFSIEYSSEIEIPTKLRGVSYRKTAILIFTVVGTSYLVWSVIVYSICIRNGNKGLTDVSFRRSLVLRWLVASVGGPRILVFTHTSAFRYQMPSWGLSVRRSFNDAVSTIEVNDKAIPILNPFNTKPWRRKREWRYSSKYF
jgi:hypothetical protein